MDMPSLDPKRWLVNQIAGQAERYRHVATAFPDNARSLQCSCTLERLAKAVQSLPDTHPLFNLPEQIDQLDTVVRECWLDELCLEFSDIAWHTPQGTQQAIKQLMDITGDSLRAWKQG